jgi:hypothetical protein
MTEQTPCANLCPPRPYDTRSHMYTTPSKPHPLSSRSHALRSFGFWRVFPGIQPHVTWPLGPWWDIIILFFDPGDCDVHGMGSEGSDGVLWDRVVVGILNWGESPSKNFSGNPVLVLSFSFVTHKDSSETGQKFYHVLSVSCDTVVEISSKCWLSFFISNSYDTSNTCDRQGSSTIVKYDNNVHTKVWVNPESGMSKVSHCRSPCRIQLLSSHRSPQGPCQKSETTVVIRMVVT